MASERKEKSRPGSTKEDDDDEERSEFRTWLPPGRRAEVEKILAFFNDTSRSTRNTYVLSGMGGSGKTTICSRFVKESEMFEKIFWIDASSAERIIESLKCFRLESMATTGQVKNAVDLVLRWISLQRNRWLMVFDGAEDVETVAQCLPPGSTGDILISTRNPEFEQLASEGAFREIGQLSAEDAVCLFLKQDIVAFDIPEIMQLKKLVDSLHCLPLVVHLSSGLIVAGQCSYAEYMRRLEEQREALSDRIDLVSMSHTARTMYSSWEVAHQLLEAEAVAELEGSLTPCRYALLLLAAVSYWDCREISIEILVRFAKRSSVPMHVIDELQQEYHFNVDAALSTMVGSGATKRQPLQNAVERLSYYNFVSEKSRGSFSLHPLIQAWVRNRYRNPTTVCELSANVLASSIGYRGKPKDYKYRRTLLPHIHACQSLIAEDEVPLEFHPKWATKFAYVYWENDQLAKAEALEEQVLIWERDEYGNDDERTLQSMADLALTYNGRSRHAEAEALNRECLKIREELHGIEHIDTLTSMHNLASTLQHMERFEESAKIQEEVLEIEKRILGEEHANTLSSMQSLATTYFRQPGRLGEVEKLEERVLELRKKVLGTDHHETLSIMSHLAQTYHTQGRLQLAVDLYQEAIAIQSRTMGVDDGGALAMQHKLAHVLHEMDSIDEAIDMMTVAFYGLTVALGETHVLTQQSLKDLNEWKAQREKNREHLTSGTGMEPGEHVNEQGRPSAEGEDEDEAPPR